MLSDRNWRNTYYINIVQGHTQVMVKVKVLQDQVGLSKFVDHSDMQQKTSNDNDDLTLK